LAAIATLLAAASAAAFLAAAGVFLAAAVATLLAATGVFLAAAVSGFLAAVFLAASAAEHRVQKTTSESGVGYQHHADRQDGGENQLVFHREVPRFMTLNFWQRAASSVSRPRACGQPDQRRLCAATSS
jgi:hypothetical protein